jgi:hypothetical protein
MIFTCGVGDGVLITAGSVFLLYSQFTAFHPKALKLFMIVITAGLLTFPLSEAFPSKFKELGQWPGFSERLTP